MNTTTEPGSGTDLHEAIQLLLPWYLKDALSLDERQQVERHVRTCLLCRRELRDIHKLAAAVVAPSNDLDRIADASFAAMRGKLQPVAQKTPTPLERPVTDKQGKDMSAYANIRPKQAPPGIGRVGQSLALAATVMLAMLPLALQDRDARPTTGYYTLSADKPAQAPGTRLHVVFAKDFPETGINEVLAAIHGQLIGKPNSAGAYTVQLSAATDKPDAATAITFLRERKEVLFAELVLEP